MGGMAALVDRLGDGCHDYGWAVFVPHIILDDQYRPDSPCSDPTTGDRSAYHKSLSEWSGVRPGSYFVLSIHIITSLIRKWCFLMKSITIPEVINHMRDNLFSHTRFLIKTTAHMPSSV